MRLALKRLVAFVGRLVIVVILLRYASTYFLSRKATMTVAPVIALSHGGGELHIHAYSFSVYHIVLHD